MTRLDLVQKLAELYLVSACSLLSLFYSCRSLQSCSETQPETFGAVDTQELTERAFQFHFW